MSLNDPSEGVTPRELITLAVVMLVFTIGVFLALRPSDEADETSPEPLDTRLPKIRRGANLPEGGSRLGLDNTLEWINLMDLTGGIGMEEGGKERPGEVLVRFRDQKALDAFLAKLRAMGVAAPRVSRALKTALLDFDQLLAARDLLGDDDQLEPNFFVSIPAPPEEGDIQPGTVGFGSDLPTWLGVAGDRSTWGQGVRIAVIDSGIGDHPNIGNLVRSIDIVEGAGTSSHGTAVASLISGQSRVAPGLAPAAELVSVKIAGADGLASSFDLATGIVEAVDAGADLINISMGSAGDSPLVRDAVAYATERGTLIVAATGNEGSGRIAFPAAYPEVVAVGAVDANSDILDFSNYGEGITTAAPGLGLNAAVGEDALTSFSGTSASTGVVTGALAAIMTMDAGNRPLSPQAALDLYTSYANEGGVPGTDPYYGEGIPDLGRVRTRNTAGVVDAAVASQVLLPATDGQGSDRWLVVVENRGTEQLVNTTLDVTTPTNNFTRNITVLNPGQTRVYEFNAHDSWFRGGEPGAVSAVVRTDTTVTDYRTSNNTRTDTLPTPEPVP